MSVIDIEGNNLFENENLLKKFTKTLIDEIGLEKYNNITHQDIINKINKLQKIYKTNISKMQILHIYNKYYNDIIINNTFSTFMIKKKCRSKSGVLVVTIVLKPSVFSCPKKCSYCPTETDLDGNPTQPKSYLSSEPAMLRALQYDFDIKGQIQDRINSYINTGNIKSNNSHKLEIILSGGTWESYPFKYRNQVINEIYWACNIINHDYRNMYSLEEEQIINENSLFRVIGLTIETRPDYITNQSIIDYRRWGITRIQIGVQHYDDTILEYINRECYTDDTKKAIRLLRGTGFKIVCHLMPDLPGSSPELDKWMFNKSINDTDLLFDELKIYPTAVCNSFDDKLIVKSDITDWYNDGLWTPYAETNLQDLIDVLIDYKSKIQPYVRIQRLIRDIPAKSMLAGYQKKSHLREIIEKQMKQKGLQCNCIRCKEIGFLSQNNVKLSVHKYIASDGIEYFITCGTYDNSIFSKHYQSYLWYLFCYYIGITKWWDNTSYNNLVGFCRLRFDNNPGVNIFNELENTALIRELHVYGQCTDVNKNNKNSSQHKGYGKLLLNIAEQIAIDNKYNKIAVISGVGVREYYRKNGYYLSSGNYMFKNINKQNKLPSYIFIIILLIIIYLIKLFILF
jgi:ELP3 family radical SAM enzyme/protein acetyltransferase